MAAIAGGISGGTGELGELAKAGKLVGDVGKAARFLNGGAMAGNAARAAQSSALTQGIGVAVGLQKKFDERR